MVQKRRYKPEGALYWLSKARSELAHSRNPDPGQGDGQAGLRDVRQIAVTIVQHAERRIPEIFEQRCSMPGRAGKLTFP